MPSALLLTTCAFAASPAAYIKTPAAHARANLSVTLNVILISTGILSGRLSDSLSHENRRELLPNPLLAKHRAGFELVSGMSYKALPPLYPACNFQDLAPHCGQEKESEMSITLWSVCH